MSKFATGYGGRVIGLHTNRLVRLTLVLILGTFLLAGCGGSSSKSSQNLDGSKISRVGFDLDDTLVFSTPAFNVAFNRDVRPFSDQFWSVVNSSDAQHSCLKPKTIEILQRHQRKNRRLYVITAREPENTAPVRQFVKEHFQIPKNHVYFEPDGKADLLKKLKIDIYYGDSDSDIKAARKAGIRAIRVQRSPESNYDEKYNPGKFDEKIIKNSAHHDCSL